MIEDLHSMDFELVYLAALTRSGLKPLSRWEDTFDRHTETVLHALGLQTQAIERSIQSGPPVRELIFSRSSQCLAQYASCFDRTPIAHHRAAMRIEGRLFGYPSCCIESFIAQGYARHALRRTDQRILFHWACPSCQITPLLLPRYRSVFRQCRKERRLRSRSPQSEPLASESRWARPRLALAKSISIAAWGSCAAAAALNGAPADPHQLPLDPYTDPDADLLASSEEFILGSDPALPDENLNLVPDGSDLALTLSAAIDALSDKPSTIRPYLVHQLTWGLESCSICGATANMGFVTIVNPLENQKIDIPYISKHFMEHGSFSYSGSVHSGRLNPPLLRHVLASAGLGHFLAEPPETDVDDDGLRNQEEALFHTDPAVRDSDANGLIDGIDEIRKLRAQLDELPRAASPETGPKDRPFIVEHPMDGIETCPRCGERVVMGIWDVIHPSTGASISIPSMALHFMQHGGPSWQGGQLMDGQGRVDPRHLQAVLTGQGDGHRPPVQPDADADLIADPEEIELGSNPENADENGNQTPDGIDLARQAAAQIAALPAGPTNLPIYRLDFLLRGLERCDICGATVNMGHLTVVNSAANLYSPLPYLALHCLEHGSFTYAGNVHGAGRIDVSLLIQTLQSAGPSHQQPAQPDADHDGLENSVEPFFHCKDQAPDTDLDGVPDGFQVALALERAIAALPRAPRDSTFAAEHPADASVPCSVCGASINAGSLDIVNPREHLTVTLSRMALHFLRHGSLAAPPPHPLNPRLIDIALHGDGSSHLVPGPDDADKDGLSGLEEAFFGTLPDATDSDGDGVPDGAGLARELHRRIRALPIGPHPGGRYQVQAIAKCEAPCPICGERINCGHVTLVNAWANHSMEISFMNLHFLERGSLAASTGERIDPIQLAALLEPAVTLCPDDRGVVLRWRGLPGRTYQVFAAPTVRGPWNPGPVFSGAGDMLAFDEPAAAGQPQRFYQIRMW